MIVSSVGSFGVITGQCADYRTAVSYIIVIALQRMGSVFTPHIS
jgi:hypothetical protein